jgi:hypothetical protein
MKNIKLFFTLLGVIWLFSSCSHADEVSTMTRTSCQGQLSFDQHVVSRVNYLPNNDNLQQAEKAIMIPQHDLYTIKICNKGNGIYFSEINCTPDVGQPAINQAALGVRPTLTWKSITENGTTKLYNADNELLSTSSASQILAESLAKMEKFNKTEMISDENFLLILNEMKKSFIISNLPNGDFKLHQQSSDGSRTEMIISKVLQREISFEVFDASNNHLTSRDYYYDVLAGGIVVLTGELFETYTKSPMSDKTMVISELLTYNNVTFN